LEIGENTMPINREDMSAQEIAGTIRSVVGYALKGIIGIIALFILFGSWFTVAPGEVALKIRFGRVIASYDEGIHLKMPMIEGITKFSKRVQRADIKTQAFSKDLQTMTSHLAVNYRLNSDTISSIYRNLGENYIDTIVDPLLQESFKAITAKYSADTIIAQRNLIIDELNTVVKERLKKVDIIVTDISIVDLDFSAEFLKSVEEKQIAEQDSKKAEKLVMKARMDADSFIAKARGEAEALRMQREQVTPQLIELRKVDVQLKAIEKWNGVMPTYSGGAMPFIQLPAIE
jgi:prohibitin 2